jgi:hypothetical protein
MLSVARLNVIYAECLKYALYTQCHYAKCHYAECRYAECHGAICTPSFCPLIVHRFYQELAISFNKPVISCSLFFCQNKKSILGLSFI